MNGKKGITDLIRGDATCPYMKNIPGLKKDFEVFKKDGSVSIKDFEVLKKHQGLFGKHQGLFATFSASCIFFNVRTHQVSRIYVSSYTYVRMSLHVL